MERSGWKRVSKTCCRQSNFSRTEILWKSQRLIKITVSFFHKCLKIQLEETNFLEEYFVPVPDTIFFHDMWSTMAPFLIVNVSFIVCVLLWWSNVYLSTFQCHTETKFDPHLPFKIRFFFHTGGICESIKFFTGGTVLVIGDGCATDLGVGRGNLSLDHENLVRFFPTHTISDYSP